MRVPRRRIGIGWTALLALAWQVGQPASAAEPDFSGTWVPEEARPICAVPGVKAPRFVVSEGVLTIDGEHPLAGSSCAATGSRRITASRMYLDLACVRGTDRFPLPLDINRLDEHRLLVAERPLGVAQVVVRCQMMRG